MQKGKKSVLENSSISNQTLGKKSIWNNNSAIPITESLLEEKLKLITKSTEQSINSKEVKSSLISNVKSLLQKDGNGTEDYQKFLAVMQKKNQESKHPIKPELIESLTEEVFLKLVLQEQNEKNTQTTNASNINNSSLVFGNPTNNDHSPSSSQSIKFSRE